VFGTFKKMTAISKKLRN